MLACMSAGHGSNSVDPEILGAFACAMHADDVGGVRRILGEHRHLRPLLNEPIGPFDSPAILGVRSVAMLEALLEAGADIQARSRWWAGGFGLLDSASPELAEAALARGARLDAHSAARLGKLDELRRMILADPALVHARGGDGQTPLHFASRVDIADFLLENGADPNARDVDHDSTPAQYMIRDRQEIARHLIARGAKADLFMAAALGDLDLARRLLQENPDSIRLRVDETSFPKRSAKQGGTIYQWTLGWHVSPHQVAREFGRAEVFEFLMAQSPPEVRLTNACWIGDEALGARIAQAHPDAAARLDETSRRQIAHAARNNNLSAVRLMLEAGWPIDARGQHHGTPLHWACWHGNAAMVELLLRRQPPLELPDADFRAPPIGWAMHGSENGWQRQHGDYGRTVQLLLQAGARRPAAISGSAAVREALAR